MSCYIVLSFKIVLKITMIRVASNFFCISRDCFSSEDTGSKSHTGSTSTSYLHHLQALWPCTRSLYLGIFISTVGTKMAPISHGGCDSVVYFLSFSFFWQQTHTLFQEHRLRRQIWVLMQLQNHCLLPKTVSQHGMAWYLWQRWTFTLARTGVILILISFPRNLRVLLSLCSTSSDMVY